MGVKCHLSSCLFSGLVALSAGVLTAQASLAQNFGDQSAQQVYYQPLSQQQYAPPIRGLYEPPIVQQGGQPVSQAESSMLQRAEEILRAQQLNGQPETGSGFDLRSTTQISSNGTRIQFRPPAQVNQSGNNQSDESFGQERISDVFGDTKPTGPKQKPQDTLVNPFADPPMDDEPQQESPFAELLRELDNAPPEKIKPAVEPPANNQDPLVRPTEDSTNIPETQDPPMRDPVLPPDAEFNPGPGQQPGLPNPNASDPPRTEESGQPPLKPGSNEGGDSKPETGDYPPGTVKPEGNRENPPEANNRYRPPAGVYRPPPVDNMPSIVHPGQAIPYWQQHQVAPAAPGQFPNYPAPGYQSPVYPAPSYQPQMNAPAYQPAYQPIPGIPDPPGYETPAPPMMAAPYSVAPPSNVIGATENNVYSNVVGESSDCQTCILECPNFYFSFFGGYNALRDLNAQFDDGQVQADAGTGFGFALGRRNGRNLRTELEFAFRSNDITGYQNGVMVQSFDGELGSFSGMANAYWEFIDVPRRCFKPYVGAGVGFMSIDTTMTNAFGQNLVAPGAEKDTSFAYQWMAGINYKAYRNMDLFAEYRFVAADTFRMDTNIAGLSGRYDFENDGVLLGLRWKF